MAEVQARRGDPRVIALAAAIILGLIASGLLVMGRSSAAFTAKATNGANSWSSGSVTITDDTGGDAPFEATGVAPGGTGEKCIKVNYTGTVNATGVRLYASTFSDPNTIGGYLTLTIHEGSGGSFGSCAGFTASGAAIYTGTLTTFGGKNSYATGVSSWAPTPGTSRVYRIAYSLSAGTPESKAGSSSTVTFTWEARR